MSVRNHQRLYGGHKVNPGLRYKMSLVYWTILVPLGRFFEIVINSGGRTIEQQANQPKDKRAKKVSQHVLWEAADFRTEPMTDMIPAFHHLRQYLGCHQLIIYFEHGVAKHLHASIKSENIGIIAKVLVNRDGVWSNFDGLF